MVSRTVGSVWRNWNDNRHVPYLSSNAGKRNLNLNWLDNRWDEHYRFAAVRMSFHLVNGLSRGEPIARCLLQPAADHAPDLPQSL